VGSKPAAAARGLGSSDEEESRPAGLGIAVVFDWALAAQLTTQAIASLGGHLGQSGGVAGLASRLGAATIPLAAGEALRRGVEWVRIAQIALTSVITVAGVVAVVRLITGGAGRGLVLSAIIEVTFAPFIAWRLAQPQTARWFAAAQGRGAAPRLSGPGWVSGLVAWSAAWGVLVAWSQSL
jgi:hypothetical protein